MTTTMTRTHDFSTSSIGHTDDGARWALCDNGDTVDTVVERAKAVADRYRSCTLVECLRETGGDFRLAERMMGSRRAAARMIQAWCEEDSPIESLHYIPFTSNLIGPAGAESPDDAIGRLSDWPIERA